MRPGRMIVMGKQVTSVQVPDCDSAGVKQGKTLVVWREDDLGWVKSCPEIDALQQMSRCHIAYEDLCFWILPRFPVQQRQFRAVAGKRHVPGKMVLLHHRARRFAQPTIHHERCGSAQSEDGAECRCDSESLEPERFHCFEPCYS